jgi:hypothetical protein
MHVDVSAYDLTGGANPRFGQSSEVFFALASIYVAGTIKRALQG